MGVRDLIENAQRSLYEVPAVGIVTDSLGRPTGTALHYTPPDRMLASFASENDPHFLYITPEQIKYSFDGREWIEATDTELDLYGLVRLLDPRFILQQAVPVSEDSVELDRAQVPVDAVMDVSDMFARVPRELFTRTDAEGLTRRQVHLLFASTGLISFRQRDFYPSGEDVTVLLAPFSVSPPGG